MNSIVLLTLLLTFRDVISECDPLPTCNPIEDCKVAGSSVPDPDNCHNYYYCLATGTPNSSPIPCNDGNYFDATTCECKPETNFGVCDKVFCSSGICSTQCTEFKGEVIANTLDCSKYYVCTPTGAISAPCKEPNPYFNGQVCGSDPSECCNFCNVQCRPDDIYETADPKDCNSYYICTGNPSNPTISNKCSPGDHFDSVLGKCVPGFTCDNICSDIVEITTTTSTSTTSKTTTTTVMSSTVPGNLSGCLDTYDCIENGNFPRCDYCQDSFFFCYDNVYEIQYCPPGKVFNTNQDFPYCLLPENCPFLS